MIFVARPSPCWSDSELYRKLLADPDWVAEPKHDGWRLVAHFVSDGRPACYTRRGKLVEPGEVLDAVAYKGVPQGTVLDGEWMRSKGEIVFFDCPKWRGWNNTEVLLRRRRMLIGLVPELGPCRIVQRLHKDPDVLDRALRAGHEGIVLKNNDSLYPFGKTTEWVKVRG